MTGWILIAVAAGASATLYLSAALGSLLALWLANMSTLPLFLIGLSKGWWSAAVAAIASSVVIAVVGGLPSAGMHLAVVGLPAALLVQRALLARHVNDDPSSGQLEWYPPGLLLTWLAGLPAVVLVAASVYFMGGMDGLRGEIARFVEHVFTALIVTGPDTPGGGGTVEALKGVMVDHLPGWSAALWGLMLIGNGVLAQAVLMRLGHNLRPAPDITEIDLPIWAPVPLLVAIALGYAMEGSLGYLGTNLMPVLALPFFVAGLGFVHAVLPRNSARSWFLAVIYIVTFTMAWVMKAVVVLGLADQILGLRRRLNMKPPSSGATGGPGNGT